MTISQTGDTSGSITSPPDDHEVDVYGVTHPGRVRTVNQDHFLISSLRKRMEILYTSLGNLDELPLESERLAYLAMVADGVGGGVAGEQASRLAVEEVTQYLAHSMRCYYTVDAHDQEQFSDALQAAAEACHASVVKAAERDPTRRGMATTLTLWIGVWPYAYLLQIGDSRFYLYGEGQLTQVSHDQTMAQELVDRGVLTRTAAHRTHWANVLSSSIGGQQTFPVVTRIDQSWEHVGLLCSDGLTKHVSDEQIAERLRSMTSAKQACEALVDDALAGGGSDNITVIVGRIVRKA